MFRLSPSSVTGNHRFALAVATAFPEVAHGLCHFHYLREAEDGIYDADRHAKKKLKKRVRGVRALERSVTNPEHPVLLVL